MTQTRGSIELTIDDRPVRVAAGSTIWEAARTIELDIPVLCHDARLGPVGVCRLCLVDVGGKKLTAACIRVAEDGMKVVTSNEKIEACRRGLLELLLADYPYDADSREKTGVDELLALAGRYELPGSTASPAGGAAVVGRTSPVGGIPAGEGRPADGSSKVIYVDHQACILCDRCIRACDDVQVNDVIGRTGKGYGARIGFDLDVPMGESTCVSCGECEKVCPTGALSLQDLVETAAGGGDVGELLDGWEYV